jgi:hypothetical protein
MGFMAALISVIGVLLARAGIVALWPDLAAFDPLGSVPRAILFTAVPAVAATGIFAWLAARRERPLAAFVKLAAVVLVLSFIPDFVLPIPNKTVAASAAAAFLHVVAAVAIVGVLVKSSRRECVR